MEWKDGSKYVGQWRNDMKNGSGIETFEAGVTYEKYEGRFTDNLFDGYGILYWKNGEKYDGCFERGSPHGFGIKYSRDGNIIAAGQWNFGSFQS